MLRTISHVAAAVRDLLHIRRDPVGYARSIGVAVGNNCRLIDLTRKTFGSEPYLVRLGDRVALASEVQFITHDGGVWIFRDREPDLDVFGPIVLGNNVFVGFRTTILPGVTIGDNCVIGAGSVVTRNIPANSVAAGVPARVIRASDGYWAGLKDRAMRIRSLPPGEKRKRLELLLPPGA